MCEKGNFCIKDFHKMTLYIRQASLNQIHK